MGMMWVNRISIHHVIVDADEPVIYELVPLLLGKVLLLQREIMFPAAPIAGLPVGELDEA